MLFNSDPRAYAKLFADYEEMLRRTAENAANKTNSNDDERVYHADDFKNSITENDDNQFDFLFNNGNIRYFIWQGYCWFIGKDICDYLEYDRANDAINAHVSGNNKILINLNDSNIEWINTTANHRSNPSRGNPNVLCITEQGVYELTRFSHMPKADKFYEWIHNRVLPNIRRTGTYMTPTVMADLSENPELVNDKIQENMSMPSWNDLLTLHYETSQVDPNDPKIVKKFRTLQEAFISLIPEDMHREKMAALRAQQVDHDTIMRTTQAAKDASSKLTKKTKENGELKKEVRELKSFILDNGLSLDCKRQMCYIIPDEIRSKLSYEEFKKLTDSMNHRS